MFILCESPDGVKVAQGGATHYLDYQSANNSYTVALLKDTSHVIVMKDGGGDDGHRTMREIIFDHRLTRINRLKASFDIKAAIDNGEINQITLWTDKARIWRNQKVMSFWKGWNPNMVAGANTAIKLIGDNPAQYAFELDGASFLDASLHTGGGPSCMTYNEFKKGRKDTPPTDEEEEMENIRTGEADLFRTLMAGAYQAKGKKYDGD